MQWAPRRLTGPCFRVSPPTRQTRRSLTAHGTVPLRKVPCAHGLGRAQGSAPAYLRPGRDWSTQGHKSPAPLSKLGQLGRVVPAPEPLTGLSEASAGMGPSGGPPAAQAWHRS